MTGYINLVFTALWSPFATVILLLIKKFTRFGKLKNIYKQIIIGIVFGIIAIMGTEMGVPVNGAQINTRDAAVLTAGLFFGAPAGIIAGTIGTIERFFAVYWGITTYTRTAGMIATFSAGIYAAFLRKYLFENKKPGVSISLAIGVVAEVFHMTMVFITHMDSPNEAMAVVMSCSYQMIAANAISVTISAIIMVMFNREKAKNKNSQTKISQTIQRWLLATVVLAFAVTSIFVYKLQDGIASTQTDTLLSLAVDDTSADIKDASDSNLLSIAHSVSKVISANNLRETANQYGLAEINFVGKDGKIFCSTDGTFVGFDMSSGEQAAEFLCLLDDTDEYVQDFSITTHDESVMRKYAGVKTEYGFLQVGYDEETLKAQIDKQVIGITKNRHVGQTGYVIITDSRFKIVSAPAEIKQKNLTQAADRVELPAQQTTFTMTINGTECCCNYIISEGYYIFAILPQTEAIQMRNVAMCTNTFLEILVFSLLFLLIYLLIKKVVVNRIKSINDSLSKITGGDLNEIINVRTNEEFASLSDDINSTVDTLKKYISEASARIDAELEFAKNIQASALPGVTAAFTKRKDFDIFASMQPAKEVGGDFYDFYFTDNDTLNFLIADVSGKGIPAAMFMMRAMTELKSLTESGKTIDGVFTHGNNALCEGNDSGMFVTAWQGGIDLNDGKVYYTNAGHNPPVIRHNDGTVEFLKTRAGFVLAGMEDFVYKKQELQLVPGDIIFLYTDGVTEATDKNNNLYGDDRLLNIIRTTEFESMKELCLSVKRDVDEFVGDAPQFDDITMVALEYKGIPSMFIKNAQTGDITAVTNFIEAELEKLECPMKAVMQIDVAVDELFSNIVNYGYPNSSGPVTVKVMEHDEPRAVTIRFEDEGIPYNPLTKEDPDITLSADERTIGGLGIFVVKKTMDDIKYKYEGGKNILTIKKLM